VRIEVSGIINRPPEVVFQFIGFEQVRNHPRWDTKMELEQLTPGPLGVGTIVRRRHTRAGYPIDGTMECVEFDPPRAIAFLIHDGPVEMSGRQLIEPEGANVSKLTISVDIPGAPNPLDPMPVENSVRRIKELIESETPPVGGG
ncbi:MAG: SRPBCC family protein, partial [Candidatus Limnocylindrales bacterium]